MILLHGLLWLGVCGHTATRPEYFVTKYPTEETKILNKIGFGSCLHQGKAQPIFEPMYRETPDLFLFIGDNIYGDSYEPEVLRVKYAQQAGNAGFKKFVTRYPILAMWDDHDFGYNDIGSDYPKKEESKKLFLDFFSEPEKSLRRQHAGIYDAKIFGPLGKAVQIILLDTRYFRSKLTRTDPEKKKQDPTIGDYLQNVDPSATILGEAQWKWLEEQFKKPAEIRLVISSIQFVSEEHGWEKWANIPKDRQRMLDLIQSTEAEGVIFLSGDRHHAELSWLDGPLGYKLFDFTASGLNQAVARPEYIEKNIHRLAVFQKENHYGLVQVDWKQSDPEIRLIAKDESGDYIFQKKLRLSQLKKSQIHH